MFSLRASGMMHCGTCLDLEFLSFCPPLQWKWPRSFASSSSPGGSWRRIPSLFGTPNDYCSGSRGFPTWLSSPRRDNGYSVRILYYLMYECRPFERKNGAMSSRIASWDYFGNGIASWDYFGNVFAISVTYYKVVAGRIWRCLPFDRKIWLTSRPSIMVSYLKHQSTAELSLPLRFDFKKCVNIRSASLEPRNW